MTKLSIPDMSCGHCKAAVNATIKSVDPDAKLDFDMTARTVSVQSITSTSVLLAHLETAGYPSSVTNAS